MILTIISLYLISVVYTHHWFNVNKPVYRYIMYNNIKEGEVEKLKDADEFFENYHRTILIMSHVPVWNMIQVFLMRMVKNNINRNNGKL